jgi:hypothetical protein
MASPCRMEAAELGLFRECDEYFARPSVVSSVVNWSLFFIYSFVFI